MLNTDEQNVIHFVGKDTLLEDYCWTLGYYLTLQNDGENDKLFPTFEKSITTQEDEADSHVSKVFSQCFSLVNKIAERYMIDSEEEVLLKSSLDEFFIGEIKEHKDLKAHGAKKHGIQILGDLLTVSIQDISMRGGWALKAFNTFLTIGLVHYHPMSEVEK